MPVSFRFTDNATGDSITLAEIDNLIRKDFNEEPNDERFSPEYEVIVEIGIVGTFSGPMNKDKVEEFMTELKCDDDYKSIVRKYLWENYSFTSWRSYFR